MTIPGITNKHSILEQTPDEFLTVCPLCGCSKSHLLYDRGAIYNDPSFTTKVESHICHQCSVIFSNPRLSEEIVKQFYKEEQGILHKNQSMEGLTDQLPKSLTKLRIRFFSEWITDRKRVLEIGGGGLNFAVSLAKQYENIQIDELDPSFQHDYRLLPNLRLSSGFFGRDYQRESSSPYEIIVAFHVLEHQHNPIEFLVLLRKNLVSNGVVFIEVPYPFSPFWIRKPIDGCFRTVHPFNFTRRSLQYAFQKVGFTVLKEDISSLAMLRIAARVQSCNENETNDINPITKKELEIIDKFIKNWKIYSKISRNKYLTKLNHLYAKYIWHKNDGINQL